MKTIYVQIICIVVIFSNNAFWGMVPIFLGKFFDKRVKLSKEAKLRYISYASCFGAGVFLYVGFLGLLPDSVEKFHHILNKTDDEGEPYWSHAVLSFPWPFFIVLCGFFFIFTLDKVVHATESAKHAKERHELYLLQVSDKNHIKLLQLNEAGIEPKYDAIQSLENTDTGPKPPSSLIILIAICMHAIFEGMAVGLQTSAAKVWSFALAMLIHEVVMSFTFGLTLAKQTYSKWRKVLYVLIFSSAIPSGITIGILMQNADTDVSYMVSAVFEAFAPGIFLHVIFIEIIGPEFSDHFHSLSPAIKPPSAKKEVLEILKKILCIISGLALIIAADNVSPHPKLKD